MYKKITNLEVKQVDCKDKRLKEFKITYNYNGKHIADYQLFEKDLCKNKSDAKLKQIVERRVERDLKSGKLNRYARRYTGFTSRLIITLSALVFVSAAGGTTAGVILNLPPDPLTIPLTFTCKKSGGTLKLAHTQVGEQVTNLTYQINNKEAKRVSINTTNVVEIATNLKKGDKVKISGNNPKGFSYLNNNVDTLINEFITGKEDDFTVSGNIMSLLSETHFANLKSIPSGSTFKDLFATKVESDRYCNISDASRLRLPATQLTEHCYDQLFYFSTHLVKSPLSLPATKLEKYCYNNMFMVCQDLITSPKIDATTLEERCCSGMFFNCSSLVNPPKFDGSSSTPAKDCFGYMFRSCNSLEKALVLSSGPLEDGCYAYMFADCVNLMIANEEGKYQTKIFTCPSLTGLNDPVTDMFSNTGGTFKGTPVAGETYYYIY